MTRKTLVLSSSLVLGAMAVIMLSAIDAMAKRAPGAARHRPANHASTQRTAPHPSQSGQAQNGAVPTPLAPSVKWEGPDLDATRNPPAAAPSNVPKQPKGYIGGSDDGSSI